MVRQRHSTIGLKFAQIVAQRRQKFGEAVWREEVDVFGEEGEDAAHQERRDGFGGVILFERAGEVGEVPGDVARDAGGDAAGVEGERVEPDGAETVADELGFELFEPDAVSKGIGERDVRLPGARKIGEELDGIADIHHHQEGRPALGSGERFGVLLGLIAGAEHGLIPSGGAAHGGSAAPRDLEEQRGFSGFAALFGFEHEAALFVEVDEAGARNAGRVAERNGTFEDVVIPIAVGDSGVGTRDFQVVAEFGEEEGVVGPLGGARVLPPLDKWS